jgi:hypothetical protein
MKYGPTFKQDMDPHSIAQLPKLCEYVGLALDLQHLRGLEIPTADVEKLVYVGERDNIEVVLPTGDCTCPWRRVEITEYDANGKPIVDGYGRGVKAEAPDPKRTMSTAELAAVGLTDDTLDQMSRELLGEPWEPDRPGPSKKRLDHFIRVMDAAHG